MANINENRKLMVENMKKVKAQLSEGKKRLTVMDSKGHRIMQAIRNNGELVDVRTEKKRGNFSKEDIPTLVDAALPVLKNSIKAALSHKYTIHPDIADNPSDTHRDYYRFRSKKEIQDTLDKTMKGLKEMLVLIDAATKKPSYASLQRVGDLWWSMFREDAGPQGYLGSHIVDSGNRQSSFI